MKAPAPAPTAARSGSNKRRVLIGAGIWLACMLILFPAWIGTAILLGSTERNAGGVALNVVLTIFIAVVGLPLFHRAMYRWFWHIERKRLEGMPMDTPLPKYDSEPTAPAPRIDWPWPLRLRHALVHVLGIATLIYIFLPYANQLFFARIISQYSGGRASAGSLNSLIFFYLPLAAVMGLAVLLTWRQMRRRDAGLLADHERQWLEAETTWLFSWGAAFVMALLLCRFSGSMITRFL